MGLSAVSLCAVALSGCIACNDYDRFRIRDGGAIDAPSRSDACDTCMECDAPSDCADDGLACTAPPVCTAGRCVSAIANGACLIDGVCRVAGEHPSGTSAGRDDPCRECVPARSATQWSANAGVDCDDDLFCTLPGMCNESGICETEPTCPVDAGCDEETDACGCSDNADCGEPTYGDWSECIYEGDACGPGQHSRQVMRPVCEGACLVKKEIETETSATDCPPPEAGTCCEDFRYGICDSLCRSECHLGSCTRGYSRCEAAAGCAPGDTCLEVGDVCIATDDCPHCCNGVCCP